MIYRTSKEQIAEYYLNPAMNQSSLKIILSEGVQSFLAQKEKILAEEKYYEEKTHFVIGKGVDCLITEGPEIFAEQFHVSTLAKKPSETLMSIINMAFDNSVRTHKENSGTVYDFTIDDTTVTDEFLYPAIEAHNYQANWKAETRVSAVVKEGRAYWEFLKEASGKQILSEQEAITIKTIAESFTNNPNSANLFRDSSEIDILYQTALYFEIDGIACKCLADMIIVDHKYKRIVPIDIKTMGFYVTKFIQSIRSRRYDIQASFYSNAISLCKKTISDIVGKSVEGYTISDFAFLVESTLKPGTPLIYILKNELLHIARDGDKEGKEGWMQALTKYKIWGEAGYNVQELISGGIIWVDENWDCDKIF